MKQLSSFIETTQSAKPFQACRLKFYLRDKQKIDGQFRLVEINLQEKSVRNAIYTILKTCNLDTQYLEKIPSPKYEVPKYSSETQYKYRNEYDIYTIVKVKRKIDETKRTLTLR